MRNIIRRPFRYTNNNAVFWLIGINIVIFAVMQFMGNNYSVPVEIPTNTFTPQGRHIILTGNIDLFTYLFSMWPYRVINDGTIWTFVTYMFMHGSVTHILFNMLGLYIFGVHVERQMGSREFLLYYFVTGALAGIFSFVVYLMTGRPYVMLVGASGALYAVMLAYAIFYPASIIYIWGILPLRAPVMVLGYTALELFSSITRSNSGVAHLTHLAGFAFGWLYFMIRYNVNPLRRLLGR